MNQSPSFFLQRIECLKTKNKVITLANHKGHSQPSEPIKTPSNYVSLTESAGKRVRFWFYYWLDEKVARGLLSQSCISAKTNYFLTLENKWKPLNCRPYHGLGNRDDLDKKVTLDRKDFVCIEIPQSITLNLSWILDKGLHNQIWGMYKQLCWKASSRVVNFPYIYL